MKENQAETYAVHWIYFPSRVLHSAVHCTALPPGIDLQRLDRVAAKKVESDRIFASPNITSIHLTSLLCVTSVSYSLLTLYGTAPVQGPACRQVCSSLLIPKTISAFGWFSFSNPASSSGSWLQIASPCLHYQSGATLELLESSERFKHEAALLLDSQTNWPALVVVVIHLVSRDKNKKNWLKSMIQLQTWRSGLGIPTETKVLDRTTERRIELRNVSAKRAGRRAQSGANTTEGLLFWLVSSIWLSCLPR